jgi:hypothetical protein
MAFDELRPEMQIRKKIRKMATGEEPMTRPERSYFATALPQSGRRI